MTRKELNIEIDMLKGNINRMCVTKDKDELDSMLEYAQTRIFRIYEYNLQKLLKEDTNGATGN